MDECMTVEQPLRGLYGVLRTEYGYSTYLKFRAPCLKAEDKLRQKLATPCSKGKPQQHTY